MARPGLEPGTPRFSVVWSLVLKSVDLPGKSDSPLDRHWPVEVQTLRILGQKGFGTPPSDAGGSIRPVPGWRSLARVRPDLAAELYESRNGELDAGAVAAASHRKAWWRCKDCGHEWEATVDNRVVSG